MVKDTKNSKDSRVVVNNNIVITRYSAYNINKKSALKELNK